MSRILTRCHTKGKMATPSLEGNHKERDSLKEYLTQLQLGQFYDVLQAQMVDMELISSGLLTDADLEKIGLPLGARKKVKREKFARVVQHC